MDDFDALTSRRPYKAAFSFERAIALLEDSRSSHFDPGIKDVFLKIAPGLYVQALSLSGNDIEEEWNGLLEQHLERYFTV